MVRKLKAIRLGLVLILAGAGFFMLSKSLPAQVNQAPQELDSSYIRQLLEGQKEILSELKEIKEKLNVIQASTNKL